MPRQDLVDAFKLQRAGCRLFGSPLYSDMMHRALEDVRSDGPMSRFLADWEGDPVQGFLPLRLLGAVHERVLAGEAPDLARHYPSAGGEANAEAAWPAFLAVLAEQPDALRPRLANFPQTNEVRRCAGLLGGFLEIAGETGLPLRLREIGCSAGLNLQWQRYRYALGPHAWGDAASPVLLETDWQGEAPRLGAPVSIESRAGCDLDPPRISSDADVRMLEAFVWPDQPDRLEALRAAVQVAREAPPRVDTARANAWLPRELDTAPEDSCTVLFHSSVWLYIPEAEQAEIRRLMQEHGARATRSRSLAWLRHEDGATPGTIEIRLRLWPGDGQDRLLGMGHPHGRHVEWFQTPARES